MRLPWGWRTDGQIPNVIWSSSMDPDVGRGGGATDVFGSGAMGSAGAGFPSSGEGVGAVGSGIMRAMRSTGFFVTMLPRTERPLTRSLAKSKGTGRRSFLSWFLRKTLTLMAELSSSEAWTEKKKMRSPSFLE